MGYCHQTGRLRDLIIIIITIIIIIVLFSRCVDQSNDIRILPRSVDTIFRDGIALETQRTMGIEPSISGPP